MSTYKRKIKKIIILFVLFGNIVYGSYGRGIEGYEYISDDGFVIFVPTAGYPLKVCTTRGVPEKFKKGIREAVTMWNIVYQNNIDASASGAKKLFTSTKKLKHTKDCYIHIFPEKQMKKKSRAFAKNAEGINLIFFDILWPDLDCTIGYNDKFWKNSNEILFFTNIIAHELGHCLGISHYTKNLII